MDILPQLPKTLSSRTHIQNAANSQLEVPSSNISDKSKKKIKKTNDFSIRFKTEVCRNWELGFCEFGDKCTFAHGLGEIRNKEGQPTKTSKACKHYLRSGYCLSGLKCTLEHIDETLNTAYSSPSCSTVASRKSSIDSLNAIMPFFMELETRGMYI